MHILSNINSPSCNPLPYYKYILSQIHFLSNNHLSYFSLKIILKVFTILYIYIYIYIYAVINKDLLYLKDKVTEIVFIKGERKKFSKT